MRGVNKYNARKVMMDGHNFDSIKESQRYVQLKLMLKAGKITDLELQPKFPIEVNGQKVCTYIADFRYNESGKSITEDVKGMLTPMYRLKKKLVKACYNIEIVEV